MATTTSPLDRPRPSPRRHASGTSTARSPTSTAPSGSTTRSWASNRCSTWEPPPSSRPAAATTAG